MTEKIRDEGRGWSRRELLKCAGAVGAAVAVAPTRALGFQTPATPRDAPENLTAAEADALDAVVARLIPSDENGPGAREARAAHYIDRALGGALAASLDAYRSGLAALDRYAQSSNGAAFARLRPNDQDAVLTALESNAATGFTPNAASFFNLVRTHTIQGTFGDPYYGGNANFVGWDLLGYPGIRLGVNAAEQKLDVHPAATHRSAYDHAMFAKKRPARAGISHGDAHGD